MLVDASLHIITAVEPHCSSPTGMSVFQIVDHLRLSCQIILILVLISFQFHGSVCSSSQPQNNELSKLQGAAALPNLQQQGTKNIQTGQALNFGHRSLMTGMTTSDEFKYGFPSDGLSIATNKWWGSSKSDGHEDVQVDGAETEGEDKHQSVEKPGDMANEKPEENGKLDDGIGPQGSGLLTAVRKRAVEEGGEALKLGVYKGYGIKKLGTREASLLLRIFKSSLQKDWIHGPS